MDNMEMNNLQKQMFYPIDHGGIIYPYTASSKWNQVFRVEADLDGPVNIAYVIKALSALKKRFPSFFVTLSHTKRYYILVKTECLPEIVPETKPVCLPFDLKNTYSPLFRITYSGNRIGLELFHSVADGNGATTFFKNLLAEYYRGSGEFVPSINGIYEQNSCYNDTEAADSFLDVYNQEGGQSSSRSEKSAYQYDSDEDLCPLRVTTFSIPADKFKDKTKQFDSTVTQLLTAVYTKALCKAAVEQNSDKDIKIEIPLDLRRKFASATVRNFSLYFNTSVPPEFADYSLQDIIAVLKPQFQAGTDIQKLRDDIYTNVKQAEMFVFRNLPNPIKKAILKLGSSVYGERLFTSPLSNLGIFELPAELSKHVLTIGFIIGKTKKNTIYSSVVTYNGTLYWNVSSVVCASVAEKHIEEILTETDIPYKVSVR